MAPQTNCQIVRAPPSLAASRWIPCKRVVDRAVRRHNVAIEYGLQTQPIFWFITLDKHDRCPASAGISSCIDSSGKHR